jgi:osmotically-inducible protein OsmY
MLSNCPHRKKEEKMKSDEDIYLDIQEKLNFEPGIHSELVTFAVHNGIVTVNGDVPSYAEKHFIKRAIRRVSGVKAVVDEVSVRPKPSYLPNDIQIAQSAVNILEWDATLPQDKIKISVEKGRVTLTGEVSWNYQRVQAERDIRYISGVVAIDNQLIIVPPTPIASEAEVHEKIKHEFERHALLDAQKIQVEINDSTITLRGQVQSWAEAKEASQVAWSIPGVTQVNNLIDIAL